MFDKPHPFPNRPSLESQVLGVLKNQVGEVKDRSEPVELICGKMVRLTDAIKDKGEII